MGILDQLETKLTAVERLDIWLESRPKQEREEWRAAFIATDQYSDGALARLLTAKGFPAEYNLVHRYRAREVRRATR
jgi:hypothetical protein